jgi:hypothetical protein
MGASDVSIIPYREVLVPTTIFMSGTATEVALQVRAATGQTANLFEARSATGALIGGLDAGGNVIGVSYRQFLYGGIL